MIDTDFTLNEWRSVISLAGIFMLRMLGVFLVLPVLIPYAFSLFENGQQGGLIVGVVMGAFPLAQVLMQVPLGWLSDRVGRKPIIVAGLVIFVLGSAVAGLAGSVWMLIVGLFIQGLGAIGSTILALIADLTRTNVRNRAMAIVGGGIGIAFGIGLIGGPFLKTTWGVSGIFFLVACLATLAIPLVQWVVPTPDDREHHDEVQLSYTKSKKLLTRLNLWRMNSSIFVLNGSLRALFVFLPLLVNKLIPESKTYLIYGLVLTVCGIVAFPLIFLAERKNSLLETTITAYGFLVIGLLMFVYSPDAVWELVIGMIFYFIGFSILEALLPSMMSRKFSRSVRGTAMGTFNMSQYLGSFGGGLLGSVILRSGRAQMCVLALIICLFVYTGDQFRRVIQTIAVSERVPK